MVFGRFGLEFIGLVLYDVCLFSSVSVFVSVPVTFRCCLYTRYIFMFCNFSFVLLCFTLRSFFMPCLCCLVFVLFFCSLCLAFNMLCPAMYLHVTWCFGVHVVGFGPTRLHAIYNVLFVWQLLRDQVVGLVPVARSGACRPRR